MTRKTALTTVTLAVLGATPPLGCAEATGVGDRPCHPGCVDETTRLVCDRAGHPRSVPCPKSAEACAAAVCSDGECAFQPAVGKKCGENGAARCNEGYACLGPGLKLTAIRQHTCAVADDGKIWCWGNNDRGELGDGTSFARANPVPVRGLALPAIAASAGYAHTCALLQDHHAYCWGDNTGGQVDASSDANPIYDPTLVSADLEFSAVVAGQGHNCGTTMEGKVYCWGNTSLGQCGVEPAVSLRVGPTEIPGLDHVVDVDTVKDHICAVRSVDPTMVCWGSNQYFHDLDHGLEMVQKLGPGAAMLNYSATPVPVDLGARVVDVGMGFESTYAVVENGTVYSWGFNLRGQLGLAAKDRIVAEPSLVMTSATEPLRGVAKVLRSDGSDQCVEMMDASGGSRYLCWGADDNGELGFGVPRHDSQYAMAATALPESAANLVRGENHGCVSTTDGERIDIACYGLGLYCATGSSDPAAEQAKPASVVWDPEMFAPPLE